MLELALYRLLGDKKIPTAVFHTSSVPVTFFPIQPIQPYPHKTFHQGSLNADINPSISNALR